MYSPYSPYGSIPLVISPYLTESVPRSNFSLSERFRMWVESLADRAEVYYHYKRVERVEVKPLSKVILMNGKYYCHPLMATKIRQMADRAASRQRGEFQ